MEDRAYAEETAKRLPVVAAALMRAHVRRADPAVTLPSSLNSFFPNRTAPPALMALVRKKEKTNMRSGATRAASFPVSKRYTQYPRKAVMAGIDQRACRISASLKTFFSFRAAA